MQRASEQQRVSGPARHSTSLGGFPLRARHPTLQKLSRRTRNPIPDLAEPIATTFNLGFLCCFLPWRRRLQASTASPSAPKRPVADFDPCFAGPKTQNSPGMAFGRAAGNSSRCSPACQGLGAVEPNGTQNHNSTAPQTATMLNATWTLPAPHPPPPPNRTLNPPK